MSRLITSPGVQFTEKDLSLRTGNPTGTSVVVVGFAAQGPTSEPITVTSINELETLFGVPTTHAEKYSYYSCKQLLTSPATLTFIRIPYGADGGSDFSSNFNGLFYPTKLVALSTTSVSSTTQTFNYSVSTVRVSAGSNPHTVTLEGTQVDVYSTNLNTVDYYFAGNSVTTGITTFYTTSSLDVSAGVDTFTVNNVDGNSQKKVTFTINSQGKVLWTTSETVTSNVTVTTGQSAWEVGAPRSVSLSEEDYSSIKRGQFDWSTPTGSVLITKNGANVFSNTNAGFFVINELQTTINETAEGHYIGFADNSSADLVESPDYDSISSMYTLSAKDSLAIFDQTKLDFNLSSTKLQADAGRDSISESLEKVGFIGFETNSYQDHLSLGIFKIRKSVSDPSRLTLTTSERYIGSLDSTRQVLSPAGGGLENASISDRVNAKSSVVKLFINPSIAEFTWTEGSLEPKHRIKITPEAKSLFPVGVFIPNSRDLNNNKQVGNVPFKLEKALRSIESTEYFTCDIILDAGLSTVYSVAKTKDSEAAINYKEDTGVNTIEDIQLNWGVVSNTLINFAQNNRKDCLALIDPPRSIFVAGKDNKILNLPGTSFTTDIYNPLRSCFSSLETSFAASYANWLKISDTISGKTLWMPPSPFVAATIATNDQVGQLWSAPAGLNRGLLTNVLDVSVNPNQKMRDRLYELGLNPIVFFNGLGYSVFGQKTLQTKPTAFDRINVRRLFNYLERTVQRTIQYFVFEPNTTFTRQRVVATLSPVFNTAIANDGIYDYMIICDERNNPDNVIDDNELIVDVYIKPVKTAEYVLLNFVATRTNQSFSELF